MALPSPMSATTGRSGSASLTPTAAAQAEEALRIVGADELAHSAAGGQRFLDDDRVARQHGPDRGKKRKRLDRRAAMVRPAPLGERLALGKVAAAGGVEPLAGAC